MRREHPFNATTNRPACSGPVGTANVKTTNGEVGTVLGPGGAALEVPQPGGSERIADAAGQGVEPTILEVNRACYRWRDLERRKFSACSGLTHQTYCGSRAPIRRRIDNRSQFDRRQQSQNCCRNRVIQKRNPPSGGQISRRRCRRCNIPSKLLEVAPAARRPELFLEDQRPMPDLQPDRWRR